ncbi:MAG: NAD(+)/NADH kinase, partial [Muribaculaceae bacterium]
METKKIGFVTNIEKDPTLQETKKMVDFVLKKGCEVYVSENFSDVHPDVIATSSSEMYKSVDFVVVIGGDGTILRVARSAAIFDTPILGINFGTLGYLADVEKINAIDAIEKVLNGDFTIENRMMLEPYVERGCVSHEINLALNEVCITNSVCSRMIKLSVEVNGEYFDTFRADGIIVSTPTGSTAYNLSAGGPILSPHTELMTITHICPHTLYARPFVIDGNDVVRIRVQSNYNNVQMSCDGQSTVQMKNDDVIIVKKSRYVTRIIKTTNMNFYDILRRKFVEV